MTARKVSKSSSSKLGLYFLLGAIEAAVAILAVFLSPSEGANAWLWGLSRSRWILVVFLLMVGAFFAYAYSSGRFDKNLTRAASSNWYWALVAIALLGTVLFFYLCVLSFKFTDELVQARLVRLLPLFGLLFLLSLQALITLPSIRFKKTQLDATGLLVPSVAALGGLVFVALLMSWTGLGLSPDRTGWDMPGVPLMATQVLLAWLIAAALMWLFSRSAGKWKLSKLDWAACIALWLLAVVLWLSQPLTPTFFSPRPQPPNAEFYPYSDAATHDLITQNVLIGEGFGASAEKPLYSFFLAVTHFIVGQSYTNVVAVQVALLALLPVVLYLLANKMHHRFAGFLLALLIILRERNTITLSGQLSVSHSKLLMTDLPTALALAGLCLLVLNWLTADRRLLRWPLWVGAALGGLLLLRSQTAIFLPPLLLIAFWRSGPNWKSRFQYAGILLLGFVLVAVPWMLRNQFVNGQFGLSQSQQGLYLAKQYSLNPEANDPGFPPNTPVSEYSSLGFARVVEFTTQYPAEVARFITAHFLHNEVSAFLALPIRFDLADKIVTFYNLRSYWIGQEAKLWSDCCGLNSHISNSPYWNQWDGAFPPEAVLPLATNLVLLSVGLAAAWRQYRWLGLLPLGMHLIYNFSTALARVSGWRLNLPVDWVLLLYYCIGIAQLTLIAWSYFSGSKREGPASKSRKVVYGWRSEGMTRLALIVLALGLVIPLTEAAIPPQFARIAKAEAVGAWQSSALASQAPLDIEAFLDQPGAVVLNGRALWPRYYATDAGEPGGQWPAFNPLSFARLGFVLIGPQPAQVVLPLQASPAAFPNAGDVIIYGCRVGEYVRAAAVLFPDSPSLDVLSEIHTFSCADTP